MKYRVLGPRVLIKVKKVSDKYENSIIARPQNTEEADTISQTRGEVVGIGSEAYLRTVTKVPWVKVGDKVVFQRYGALRVGTKDSPDYEYWVINDIDLQVIETEEAQDNV